MVESADRDSIHVNDRGDSPSIDTSNRLNLLDLTECGKSNNSRSIADLARDLLCEPLSDGHSSGLNRDLPVLGDDSFYGIDPLTGGVKAYPSGPRPDIWTKADQDFADTINKRGYFYALDPVSGKVTACPNQRTDIYTRDDANRDRLIKERGWYYGLSPRTGKVVRFPAGPQLE
jgi:hypothetical protein